MSQGPGSQQRDILDALAESGGEIGMRELRRALGNPDRSHVRRAVKTLVARGLVEEREGRAVPVSQGAFLEVCLLTMRLARKGRHDQ